MFVVILAFDQLLFRPLIASADWFRLEQEAGFTANHSWALTMMRRSRLLRLVGPAFARHAARRRAAGCDLGAPRRRGRLAAWHSRWVDYAWYGVLILIGLAAVWKIALFVLGEVHARRDRTRARSTG